MIKGLKINFADKYSYDSVIAPTITLTLIRFSITSTDCEFIRRTILSQRVAVCHVAATAQEKLR